MADIQSHVRLKAIATCAKAAEYKPPTDQGIQLDYYEKDEQSDHLPERLFIALECLLDDPVDKVRKAAAITLYSLSRPSEKVTNTFDSASLNVLFWFAGSSFVPTLILKHHLKLSQRNF